VLRLSPKDFLESIISVVKTAEWVDILDILLLSYIIYAVIKMVRETRAGQLMKGLLVCLAAFIISNLLEMKAITYLFTQAIDIGLLALIIMFQPELRRALEKAGHGRWGLNFSFNHSYNESAVMWNSAIDAICDSCVELSATYTGALIVVERQTKLGEQIDNGTILNAQPSKELFGNIFYPKTPLHDGAVIMREGMIMAAACFLPKPQKEELVNKKLGSRHRAAIGMSENSDAIVIVVSEETGAISVAENGILTSGYTREKLRQLLQSRLIEPNEDSGIAKATKHILHIAKRKGRDK